MAESIAVLYEPGPNWVQGLPLSQQPLRPHLDYLLAVHEQGRLIMGGPFADGSGGLVILLVKDMAEARQLVADDPAVGGGILQADIRGWNRIV